MSQKRNKIIILITLIIVIVIGALLIVNKARVSLPERDLVKQCEQELQKTNKDIQVCKINNDILKEKNIGKRFPVILHPSNNLEFINDSLLDNSVKPSDKIIISLNIKNILMKNLLVNQSNTNKQLQTSFVTDKPISLCAVVYPVIITDKLNNLTEQEKELALKQYQDNFKWEFFNSSLDFTKITDNSNVICSAPFIIKNQIKNNSNNLSFLLNLPPKNILMFIGGGILTPDMTQYGIKLLLANPSFIDNQNNKTISLQENLRQNYSQMVPLIISRHWIKL